MAYEHWTWTHEVRIPSEAAAGCAIVQELLHQMEQDRWIERDVFGVHLAIEEALVNAIKHGNRYDPQKSVVVACKLAPERVHVEIADEGPGFCPGDVPDPTQDENVERPSGRGIMLMRNFMDQVDYNESGNRVIMEKARTVAT